MAGPIDFMVRSFPLNLPPPACEDVQDKLTEMMVKAAKTMF